MQKPNPQNSDAMQRVVLAGMRLMYDQKIFPVFAQALKADPSPQGIARQAAGLVKMLQDKADGKIPRNVLIPAGMMLLFEMINFMVQAKAIDRPDDATMKAAMTTLVKLLVQVFAGAPAAPPQGGPQAVPQAAPAAPPAAPGMLNQPMGA
jgi:hypothetical protein